MTTKKERDAAAKAAAEAAKKTATATAGAESSENDKSADLGPRTKARVLVDCRFGRANDVVLETDDVIANHPGELDDSPAAVAYAEANPNPKRGAKKAPTALEE